MKAKIIFFLVCTAFKIYGQENSPDYEKILEHIIPVADEDIDLEMLSETLFSLYDHPLPINTAGRIDILSIPFLSENEAESILNYRNQYGIFLSPYELYLIPGLDSTKVNLLIPFLKINQTSMSHDSLPMMNNILKTSRKSIMLRYARLLNPQIGYINSRNITSARGNQYYLGSANYVYGRLEIHEPNDFDIGITFEKDAGEPFFMDPALQFYGFDHYAGYFRLLNRGILKEMTIGDFQMHFGEGLVFGRGFMNKSSETVGSVRNRYSGIHPYQGAGEYSFFRGLSFTLGNRYFNFTGFGSRKLQDAAILIDSSESTGIVYYVSNLSETGYHRTPTEIYKKQQLAEYTTGFNSNYTLPSGNLTFGISFIFNSWQYPIRNLIRYYNQFEFSGRVNYNSGFYYNFFKGKFNVYGEFARSKGNGYGLVQGIIANILPNFEATIHARSYSPHYYSKYSKSFSEYTKSNNEKGIYWGIKLRPVAHLEIRAYFDIFRSDWLRYNLISPSTGNEFLVYMKFEPKSSLVFDVTYRVESKYRNHSNTKTPLPQTLKGIKRNFQFKFNFQLNENLIFRTRLKGNSYSINKNNTIGYCFSQDVLVIKPKFQIKSRIAYFCSEDYLNRHYIYEHDVLYTYSMVSYNGHGVRGYVLFKYSPFRFLDFWVKTSIFHYFNIENIGSGISMIPGNKKTEIKCQVRIKF